MTAAKQAGDDFVEGAVPATGDDDIKGMAKGKRKIRGFAPALGDEDRDQIAGTGQEGNHLRQVPAAQLQPRVRIEDQEEFLHQIIPFYRPGAGAIGEFHPLFWDE